MAKKKTVEKALNIDSILFNCRDYLRAARNSGSFFEKRDMMLTLVFLRFIGEKYEDGIENLKQTLKEQGLDPENEKELMSAIEALTKEKTIIMIAHRLKTVEHADQILVLDKGQIVQQGRHSELLKQTGIYRKFILEREEAVGWKI